MATTKMFLILLIPSMLSLADAAYTQLYPDAQSLNNVAVYQRPGQAGQSSGSAGYNNDYQESKLLEIILPNEDLLEDFEYVPTDDGYRFSYKLADGTTHEEMANIPGAKEEAIRTKGADFGAERHKPPHKNRKLSPKSLQSLAG